jgi:hypothetical protein
MGEIKNGYKILFEKRVGNRILGDLGLGRRIVLKHFEEVVCEISCMWLGIGSSD